MRFLFSSSLAWNGDKTMSNAPIAYNAHDSQPYSTSSLQRKSVIVNLLTGEGKAIYVLMTSFDFIFNSHPCQLFLWLSKLHTWKVKTSECYHAQVGPITPNSFLRYIQHITWSICWTSSVCTAPVQQALLFSCAAFGILETSERTWPKLGLAINHCKLSRTLTSYCVISLIISKLQMHIIWRYGYFYRLFFPSEFSSHRSGLI